MSEITSDYYNDADVHRWKVTAKAASLSGSGSISVIGGWVLTGDELPDELLDSDLSTADASGAPTLRASTDIVGINQIALHIVNFTPASGGASGGATAEIWLNPGSYEGATDLPIYLWWGKSGKTQPAASATYGKNNVYPSAVSSVWKDDDYTDATTYGNDLTANNITNATDSPYGTGLKSYEFNGTSSYMTAADDDALDADSVITQEFWFKIDANTGTFQILLQKRNPSTTYNYGTAVILTATDGFDGGFFNGSFKTHRESWSTNFGSLDTWYHVFYELEESGSSVISRLYKGSSLVGTQTFTSTSLPVNSAGFYIGALSGSSLWLDGHVKAAAQYKTILTSDQKTTRHNNQSDPATFWDTTAAVEAGPFSTEDNPKYQWTYQGRKRSWTVQLFEDAFAGSVTYLCGGAVMIGRWGFNTGTFDDRIRASELALEVVDPELVLYNTLIDTSKSESDFKIKITDSTGTYTLRMKVRLDEVSTLFTSGLEHQVTRLFAYCGMAEMKNIDAVVLASSTLNNLFRLILISSGIGQNIEYYLAHYAENADSTLNILDSHRLNRLDLIYAEEGRKIDSMYDQLAGLMDGYGAIVTNGLDGKWHVKHEYSLGETKTDRGAQSYDFVAGSLSTLNTLAMSSKSVTSDILARSTIKYPLPPIQAVQVERGNARTFFTVDIVKHGDMENGWLGGGEHEVWEETQGSLSIESGEPDTGSFAMCIPSGSNQITQKLLRFAGGYQDIDVEVALRYALRSLSTTVTTKSGSHFVTLSYFNETTADTTAGDPGGDWTTDPINGAIALSAAAVTAGASLVYTTLVTTIYGPLPDYDGNLRIRLNSSLADFQAYYDTIEVRLKKGDNAKFNFRAVSGRYDVSGNLIGSGGVAEQRVQFYNGIIGLDNDGDDARDSTHAMMQVITTAAGDWIQASDYLTLIDGVSTAYSDLFELVAGIRIGRQSQTSEGIEGEIMDIVPHHHPLVIAGATYLQQYTEIDFRTEVTRFVAFKKEGAEVALVDPPTLYIAKDDEYGYATIGASTPWTYNTLSSTVTGREVDSIRADVLNGFLWGLEYSTSDSDDKFLTKRSLATGALIDTPISWNGSGTTAQSFAIHRANQRIYVAVKNTSTQAAGVYEYNYAGTLLRTLFAPAVGNITAVCVSPNGSYLYFRHKKTGLGPFDRLYQTTLIDGVSNIITGTFTYGQSSGVSLDIGVVDPDAGIFINAFSNIVSFPYPDGGSETVVTTNPAHNALAIDRFNQWLYYAGTTFQYKVSRIGYDGTGGGEVMYEGSGNDIQSLCIGYD